MLGDVLVSELELHESDELGWRDDYFSNTNLTNCTNIGCAQILIFIRVHLCYPCSIKNSFV